MNLRTITFWVIYDPSRKVIIAERQFKYQLRAWQPLRPGMVLVKMKGHYLPSHISPGVKR